jgi:hypothetical protein
VTPELFEAIARDTAEQARIGPGDDPLRYVYAAGLEPRAHHGITPSILGNHVLVCAEDPPECQRFWAVHEVAHLILRWYGIPDDEWSVNWLTCALIALCIWRS